MFAVTTKLKRFLKFGITLLLFSIIVFILFVPSLSITLKRENPFPTIEHLIKENHFVEANTYLTFFRQYDYVKQNSMTEKLATEIETERHKLSYQFNKVIDGLIDGDSDEMSGKIAANVSDWIFIGDIRDLSHEGKKYLQGQDVDKVVVALSVIGLGGTIASVASSGTGVAITAPFKKGVSMLKASARLGKMPKWLAKVILKEGGELAKLIKLGSLSDLAKKQLSNYWEGFKNLNLVKKINHAFQENEPIENIVKNTDQQEIKEVIEKSNLDTNKISKIIKNINDKIQNAYQIMEVSGGIELLSATDNEHELEEMKNFVHLFNNDSYMIYQLGGQSMLKLSQTENNQMIKAITIAAPFGKKALMH